MHLYAEVYTHTHNLISYVHIFFYLFISMGLLSCFHALYYCNSGHYEHRGRYLLDRWFSSIMSHRSSMSPWAGKAHC